VVGVGVGWGEVGGEGAMVGGWAAAGLTAADTATVGLVFGVVVVAAN